MQTVPTKAEVKVASEKSIAHWKRMWKDPVGCYARCEFPSGRACALCQLSKKYSEEAFNSCTMVCPLRIYGDKSYVGWQYGYGDGTMEFCGGTPFYEAHELFFGVAEGYRNPGPDDDWEVLSPREWLNTLVAFRKAAADMIAFMHEAWHKYDAEHNDAGLRTLRAEISIDATYVRYDEKGAAPDAT